MSNHASPRWFHVVACGTVAAIAGVVAFTAAAGVLNGFTSAAIAGLAALVTTFVTLAKSAQVAAAGVGVPGRVRLAFAIGALALLTQLAWTSTFIVHPTVAAWSGSPWLPIRSTHSCLSAYWIAADVVRRTPDIWDDALYNLPQADPTQPRRPRPLGPVQVDNYEYPPPFLVVPRAVALAAPGFWRGREVWFAINLAVVAAGLVAVGWRFDRAHGTQALWLTPAVLGVPAMMATLQIGNVQLAVIAAAMLAMLLFERRWHAVGGVLLAYATLSKLYPGVLILYLLLRRDWRAVSWTSAAAVGILLVTVADFGVAPYHAFLQHFPRLLGGEAFPAFRAPIALAVNESIPGVVFKLQLFGVPGMGFAASKALGWLFTLVVLAVTARLGLRPIASGREPIAWLTLLVLATLRSPFLPLYGPFPSLWLATLIAALTWGQGRVFGLTVACWAVLAFTFGLGAVPPEVNAVWTFVHTITAFVVVRLALQVVSPSPAPETAGAPLGSPLPA